MEQNYKYQQELENQGFQQPPTDIETPDEAEIRYQRFMQEEMRRQALIPKYQESQYTIYRAPKDTNTNTWTMRQKWNCFKLVFVLTVLIVIGIIQIS